MTKKLPRQGLLLPLAARKNLEDQLERFDSEPGSFKGLIPFLNHLCLGAKPQAVLTHDKAKQQRHG